MIDRPEVRAVTGQVFSRARLSGGDINEVMRLKADRGDFVLKTNDNPPRGLFASEAAGLGLLGQRGLRVPEVYLAGDDFLLMRYYAPGAPQPKLAGEMLALLHCQRQGHYGFERSTYLATLLQENDPVDRWSDFFLRRRIRPLLAQLGGDAKSDSAAWDKLFENIAPLLDTCPHASLLHGDLWSGNLYHADVGPVFIDPAIYYGDALVDIAMTRLFGGFSTVFYEAYRANVQPRYAVEELTRIYQLYPLLVHAKLFGCQPTGGSYYRNAALIRDEFI